MKKIFDSILIFCILSVLFISCGTSKLISIEEAKEKSIDKKFLILHSPTDKYKLTDYSFIDHNIVGKLEKISRYKGFNVHVYTRPINIGNLDNTPSKYIEIEELEIRKIIYKKERLGLKILAVTGGAVGAIFVFSFINFATGGFDLDLY